MDGFKWLWLNLVIYFLFDLWSVMSIFTLFLRHLFASLLSIRRLDGR